MRRFQTVASVAAVLVVAASAVARTAQDRGSDYRLRIVEPVEGATITTSTVRVTVNLARRAPATGDAKNATPVPPPAVDFVVDGNAVATLKDGGNTVLLQNVASGTHTLRVNVSDASGSVTAHQEVHFTVTPAE